MTCHVTALPFTFISGFSSVMNISTAPGRRCVTNTRPTAADGRRCINQINTPDIFKLSRRQRRLHQGHPSINKLPNSSSLKLRTSDPDYCDNTIAEPSNKTSTVTYRKWYDNDNDVWPRLIAITNDPSPSGGGNIPYPRRMDRAGLTRTKIVGA